jgi:hypothetical protein
MRLVAPVRTLLLLRLLLSVLLPVQFGLLRLIPAAENVKRKDE